MSGGRLDYICYKVDEVADQMGDRELNALMKDVGELLHDREWHLSGDICEATWLESARRFKEKWFVESREDRLKELIEAAFEETKRECLEMIGGLKDGE